MATQYTAGLTTGQVLTAATMNSIGAAWETWTPVLTPSSGTITSYTVNRARYAQIQKIVIAQADITITNVGTAGGAYAQITLPIGSRDAGAMGSGIESDLTGSTLAWQTFGGGGTASFVRTYNNAGPCATNARIRVSICYEAS